MSFPWLSQYPGKINPIIDVSPHQNLMDFLDESLLRHAGLPALTSVGRSTSYAEVKLLSERFASWLQHIGVCQSDRVAIMMPNLAPFAVAVLGALRASATVVTVNPLYTPRELAHQLHDSGAKVLLVFEAFAPTVLGALQLQPQLEQQLIAQVVVGFGMTGAQTVPLPKQIAMVQCLQLGALRPLQPVSLGLQDLAFIQYTGGTTGVSKGAMLSHGNVMANIMQMSAWMSPAMSPQEATGKNLVSFLPLYHIFALTFCLLYSLRNGMHNLLVANPRDLPGAVRELGSQPIHVLPGVNTLFAGLLAHPPVMQALNLKELKLVVGGGSAVQQGVAERWLAATGVPICEGYGLSETSPLASCNVVTQPAWTGTIGVPVSNTEIAILDDHGQPLPTGERGEIAIRGPQVMQGYWMRPEDTAQAMTVDGFFKTGDIGVMDKQGFITIVDRKKDMILVSGFNVYPNEIEAVVSTLEGVLQSAAVGVPDEKTGEAIKLFVVRTQANLREEDVVAHCRAHLTAYKCPKHIEFRETLPMSTVGKILRRELKS